MFLQELLNVFTRSLLCFCSLIRPVHSRRVSSHEKKNAAFLFVLPAAKNRKQISKIEHDIYSDSKIFVNTLLERSSVLVNSRDSEALGRLKTAARFSKY